MKRNLLILLASAGISVAGLTEASAQNENSTLSPDTLRGIALWGNKSHQNNQDSGSNKENETFLSGAEGINSKNLTFLPKKISPQAIETRRKVRMRVEVRVRIGVRIFRQQPPAWNRAGTREHRKAARKRRRPTHLFQRSRPAQKMKARFLMSLV